MSRGRLREAARKFRGRMKRVDVGDDLWIEIREPCVRDRAEYADSLRPPADGDLSSVAIAKALMQLVSRCAYDPESGQRVWADDELEQLMDLGSAAERMAAAVTDLLKEDGEVGKK